MIRDMDIHVGDLTDRPRSWAGFVEFVVNKMTDLRKLVLRSDFRRNAAWLWDTYGRTRWAQEKRCVLKLGAGLSEKHAKLKLLVYPGDTGPCMPVNEYDPIVKV